MKIRSIALPNEHGSWGLFFEPALTGLILALSPEGIIITLALFFFFLAHQPLRFFLDSLQIPSERRTFAVLFLAIYLILGVFFLGISLSVSAAFFWIPLLPASLFAIVPVLAFLAREHRSFTAELSAGLALSATAPAVVIAGGWPLKAAGFLWLLFALRVLSAITLIRAKIRSMKNKPFNIPFVLTVFLTAFFLVLVLAVADLVPWLAALGFFILLCHAMRSLGEKNEVSMRSIGFTELGFGILNSGLISLGYFFSI